MRISTTFAPELLLVIVGVIFLPISYLVLLAQLLLKGQLLPLKILPEYHCTSLAGWGCSDTSQGSVWFAVVSTLITLLVVLFHNKPSSLWGKYLTVYLGTVIGIVFYVFLSLVIFPEPKGP